jgi:FkbM family methyltransferase
VPWIDVEFLTGVCSEPLETAVLLRLLEPGMTAVDVGANQGWYTLLFSRVVGHRGRVVAFEPDPRVVRQLQRNLMLSGSVNVLVADKAASSTNGTARFISSPDSQLSHLLSEEEFQSSGEGPDAVEVETVRLADYLDQLGFKDVDILKCDVEGAEVLALEGFIPLMERGSRPIIMIECIENNLKTFHTSPDRLVALLTSLPNRPYRCLGLCRLHGNAEPWAAACHNQVNNLLCLPDETVETMLAQTFSSAT